MIASLIFSSVFVILFVLYIVGYNKCIPLMQKISMPLLIPAAVGIAIPLLLKKMPDSFHVLVISSAAIFISALQVWIEPAQFRGKNIIQHIQFVISEGLWIFLFISIFYVYRFSLTLAIVMGIIYLALFIFMCVKFEMRSIKQIINVFFYMLVPFVLNFISVFTLIYSRKLYSVFLFLGSTISIFFLLCTLSIRFKSGVSNSRIVIALAFLASMILIYASSVLMLF